MEPVYAPEMEPIWASAVADLRDSRGIIHLVAQSKLAVEHGFVIDRLLS